MAKGNAAAKAAEEAAKKAEAEKAAAEKAASEKAAAEQTSTNKVPALSVTCSREGFRRAGISWGKEAKVVKLSELNEEQIAQISGEPLLTVEEVEVDAEVTA